MDQNETQEDELLFHDLFDEVIQKIEDEDEFLERPLCDTLKGLEEHYKDFQPLAKGGMKRIFKVFDCKLNRYVAYARLHSESPQELHDPFIREARLTALLEHPNIISIHDIGIQEDNTPFFTMELKVGKNLGEIISDAEGGPKPGTEFFNGLLESFVKVCDAISFAHSKNVLHLDLKPENVQIGGFGEVIVCDWGLGKIIGDKDIEYDQLLFNPDLLNNVTRADKIVGTPGYMAPEQIETSTEKTKQTDIYSLGALLYTILTGKCAFSGDVNKVLQDTLSGKIIDPGTIGLEWQVPASLSAVALKAMSLHTAERYQSVEALKREVQNYLSGRTTLAEEAGLWKEARLFYYRNLLSCNIAFTGLLLILVLAAVFLLHLKKKNISLSIETKRALDNFQKVQKEKDKVKETLDRMIIEKDLATALLGKGFEGIRSSFELVDSRSFFEPVNALANAEAQLLSIPNEHRAYGWSQMQLNHIYLLRQEFNSFNPELLTSVEREQLSNLIFEAQKHQTNSGAVTEINHFKKFYSLYIEQPYKVGTALKILKYDGAKRKSKKQHSELVEIMLRFVNKSWEGNYDYDDVSMTLTLDGKRLDRLSLEPSELYQRGSSLKNKVSLINSLPIRKLDISGTGLSNLWEIVNVDLQELIIKNVLIHNLTPLKEIKGLKKLTVSKGLFKDKELSEVPSHVKIIYE